MTLAPANGEWQDGVFRFPFRVYYEDTDLGGMVYHGRYVSFFERVRTESIRDTVVDVNYLQQLDKEQGGPLLYVVRNINITYHRQAFAGDAVIGHSMVERVRAAAVEARQWITRGRELLAEASVLVAIIGADGRPRRWTAEGRKLWDQWHEDARNAGRL